jgi:hypothetical protein
MKQGLFLLIQFFLFCSLSFGQNTRIRDNNSIGWFSQFSTFRFSSKWSGHLEYQWRRENLVKDWQQSLFRTGVNYQLNPKVTLRAGYAWIETFPYGDIPLQAAGKRFPEHRTYQMITLTDQISKVEMSHRFMLEQRWIGRYTNPALSKPDDFLFLNRLRYMYRMQWAIGKKKIEDKTPYMALYDEILIGFGKNVNENVFDQNRVGILLGYRVNKKFRGEAGFIQQLVQLGREVNNRNVFQYNNGFVLNTYFNFDLSKGSR